MEWSRALDTGNIDDLQFSDTSTDGEYFFGVAVFDNQDADAHRTTASDVFKLVFEQPNQDPGSPTITASATTAEVDETITFDVSATDPDGDTLTYSWDFGDSTTDDGASVTHAFTEAGTYTVTVTADDGNGGTSTQTQSITVEEAAEDAGIDIIWILLIIIIIVVVVIVAVVAMKKRGPPLEEEPLEEEPVAEEEPLGGEE
ncbi:MAG: PKD domain-containing protein [Thermoplasmata archaeon]|nr:PKD domain-containing protein [Thermoplasmata archaeon]